MFTGSFSFKGISTNSVSAQNAALKPSPDLSHNWTLNSAKLERLTGKAFGPPSWLLALPIGPPLKSNSGHCLWLLCCVGWELRFCGRNAELELDLYLGCEHWYPASCVRRDALTAKSWQQQWQQTRERKSHGGLRRGVRPLRCRSATRQGGSSIYFRMIIRMQGSGKWKLYIFH